MPAPELEPGSVAVILPAAGSGRRFGQSFNKVLASLDGAPVWTYSAQRFRELPSVGRIIMPIAPDDREHFLGERPESIASLGIEWVDGGAERYESVARGLEAIGNDPKIKLVAIHDAARPLIRRDDIESVFASASSSGAAILANPISGTVRSDRNERTETVDRRHLYVALTPQVFELGLLRNAYAKHNGRPATDDAELIERSGGSVDLVVGATDNLKITYPEDLLVAQSILNARQNSAPSS